MTQLVVQPAAQRYLKKLKDKTLKQLYRDAMQTLLDNPSSGAAKHADLSDVYCIDIYYNKTNYELAYHLTEAEIDGCAETVIVVLLAGTRENFYRELKRYW